ncbi:hypothetical protein PMIN06_009112 [Paraphaeosphaeria minitans]
MESGENTDWLENINPKTLTLDYEMLARDCSNFALSFRLERSDRLEDLPVMEVMHAGRHFLPHLGLRYNNNLWVPGCSSHVVQVESRESFRSRKYVPKMVTFMVLTKTHFAKSS